MCSVKPCKKKDFKDGMCSDHWRLAQAPVGPGAVYNFVFGAAVGAAVNPQFLALGGSFRKGEEYGKRIQHLTSLGPASGGEEDVHGRQCLHDTQKSNNLSVWYSWSGNTMTVWGLGSHKGGDGAGNDSYVISCWYDGTSKTWKRK